MINTCHMDGTTFRKQTSSNESRCCENPWPLDALGPWFILQFWQSSKMGKGLQTVDHMGMDQYLLIPFLVGWTSIYQLFWCSPGVQGFWHTAIFTKTIHLWEFFFLTHLAIYGPYEKYQGESCQAAGVPLCHLPQGKIAGVAVMGYFAGVRFANTATIQPLCQPLNVVILPFKEKSKKHNLLWFLATPVSVCPVVSSWKSVLGDENPWCLPGPLEILQSKSQLPLDVAALQGWRIESDNQRIDSQMKPC